MPRAKQPVNVAGIEFDALIDEQRQLDAEIPQYATEEGFQISDAIIIDAETLSMTLYVTDTPVTWRDRHPGLHADSVCKRLEQAYFGKEPVTVRTSDATYSMMGIQSITFQKSLEIGYSKEIPVTFKKIRKTRTRAVDGIPASYGNGGETGVNAGAAKTSTSTTSQAGSILGIADGALNGALTNGISGFFGAVSEAWNS